MQPLQRTAVRASRRVGQHMHRQSRRHASGGHGSHDSHHHAGPTTESFGASFYVALAAIPASFAIYKLTAPGSNGEQTYFTRLITSTYSDYKTKWAERNDLHTQAVERAAADRVLFLNESSQHNCKHVDLRFPEMLTNTFRQFNIGSPWNVPAGHGHVNLDQLIKKYETESYEANVRKLQQLRENKVPAEQPFESFAKATPAANDS